MKANGDNGHSILDPVRFAGLDGNGMAKISQEYIGTTEEGRPCGIHLPDR